MWMNWDLALARRRAASANPGSPVNVPSAGRRAAMVVFPRFFDAGDRQTTVTFSKITTTY